MGLFQGSINYVEYVPTKKIDYQNIESLFEVEIISPLTMEDLNKESIGWCNYNTGETDKTVSSVLGGFMVGFRIDSKKVPRVPLNMAAAEAQKELKREEGEKSVAYRKRVKELRSDIEDKMIREIFPSIKIVEVFFDQENNRVYFGAAGKAINDRFKIKIYDTLGIGLLRNTFGTNPMIAHGISFQTVSGWCPREKF